MNFLMNILGYPLGWIMWLGYQISNNYVVALILFTVISRLMLVPLAIKQQKNSAHMYAIKPKMDRLSKMYAKNQQKLQEETQKLYAEENYSPFGGCLPMVIQLVLVYGLIDVVYRPLTHILRFPSAVLTAFETAAKNLKFTGTNSGFTAQLDLMNKMHNTANRESMISAVTKMSDSGMNAEQAGNYIDKMNSLDLNFFGINLGATPKLVWELIVIIPILCVVTQMISTFISTKLNTNGEQQMAGGGCMKWGMVFVFPFLTGYFATVVPAGVGLYWIIQNLVLLVQTVLLYKFYNPADIAAKIEAQGGFKALNKNKKKKKPSVMDRMMAAANNTQATMADEAIELSEEEKKAKKEQELSQKEINRRRLAEARRADAEKYGEEYVDVTDDDLK